MSENNEIINLQELKKNFEAFQDKLYVVKNNQGDYPENVVNKAISIENEVNKIIKQCDNNEISVDELKEISKSLIMRMSETRHVFLICNCIDSYIRDDIGDINVFFNKNPNRRNEYYEYRMQLVTESKSRIADYIHSIESDVNSPIEIDKIYREFDDLESRLNETKEYIYEELLYDIEECRDNMTLVSYAIRNKVNDEVLNAISENLKKIRAFECFLASRVTEDNQPIEEHSIQVFVDEMNSLSFTDVTQRAIGAIQSAGDIINYADKNMNYPPEEDFNWLESVISESENIIKKEIPHAKENNAISNRENMAKLQLSLNDKYEKYFQRNAVDVSENDEIIIIYSIGKMFETYNNLFRAREVLDRAYEILNQTNKMAGIDCKNELDRLNERLLSLNNRIESENTLEWMLNGSELKLEANRLNEECEATSAIILEEINKVYDCPEIKKLNAELTNCIKEIDELSSKIEEDAKSISDEGLKTRLIEKLKQDRIYANDLLNSISRGVDSNEISEAINLIHERAKNTEKEYIESIAKKTIQLNPEINGKQKTLNKNNKIV